MRTAHSQDDSLTAGNKSYDPAKAVYMLSYDASKAAKVFGIQYINMDECTRDILAQFREKGWY